MNTEDVVQMVNEELRRAPEFRGPRRLWLDTEHGYVVYVPALWPPDFVEYVRSGVEVSMLSDNFTRMYKFLSDLEWKQLLNYVPDNWRTRLSHGDPVLLNVGCGPDFLPRPWLNLDMKVNQNRAREQNANILLYDVRNGLRFEDAVIDHIYSSCFFEHLTIYEGLAFLAECKRVLKPGGHIRLLVPNGRQLVQQYLEGRMGEHEFISPELKTVESQGLKFSMVFFGGGESALELCAYTGHKMLCDRESMKEMLARAGFQEITFPELMKSGIPELRNLDGVHLHFCFVVEAVKGA